MWVLKEPGKFLILHSIVPLLLGYLSMLFICPTLDPFSFHLSCSDLVNDVKNSLDRVMEEERFYGEERVLA